MAKDDKDGQKKGPIEEVDVKVDARPTEGSARKYAKKVEENVEKAVRKAIADAESGGAEAQIEAAEEALEEPRELVDPDKVSNIDVVVTGTVDGEEFESYLGFEPEGEKTQGPVQKK